MKKLYILSFLFLLASEFISAQNIYNLSGIVIDKSKKKIAAGEVSLIDVDDSTVIKKTVLTNGSFLFDTTRQDDYIIKVTSFGFADKLVRVSLDESKTVTIELEVSATLEQEQTVTSNKDPFEYTDGIIMVNRLAFQNKEAVDETKRKGDQ